MSVRKLGNSRFRVDLNESNLEYLSKIVLDTLLEHFQEKCEPGELLHCQQIQERMRLTLKKYQTYIQVKINQACDQALNHPPVKSNRANLFGRALIEKIILYPETTEEWMAWFKAHFLASFLNQVRISMGIQNYDYYNELLDIALQNECMIRDLEKSRIDWHAFFSHKRLDLMLNKARQLRHWVCVLDNQNIFLDAVNVQAPEGVRPFQSKDLWQILDAWEYVEEDQGVG